MSQETRGNSIFWSILLRSKLRSNLPPKGFMQFGALIDNTSRLFQFMLFYRLCIPASYSGGRVFETGEEKIFKLNRNKGNYLKSLSQSRLTVTTVPIIVVITKIDLYIAWLSRRGRLKGPDMYQAAEQLFKQTFGHKFEKGGVSQDRPIPYALVSSSMFASDVAPLPLTSCRIPT